jgi:hypothetical protein
MARIKNQADGRLFKISPGSLGDAYNIEENGFLYAEKSTFF